MNKVNKALLTELYDKLKKRYKQVYTQLNGIYNIAEILQEVGNEQEYPTSILTLAEQMSKIVSDSRCNLEIVEEMTKAMEVTFGGSK